MASDPLSPVVRGQVVSITASAWNEVMATARDHRQPRRPDRPVRQRQITGVVEAVALNSTGAALREFRPAAVTAAGGYDVTGDAGYDWQRRPLLTLGTPTGPDDHIVVTLEAIPAGEMGRVAVAGTVLCDVHLNDSGHGYASPTTNTTALESAEGGSVRILHKGTGSSTRRCVVYLFSPTGGVAGCDYPMLFRIQVGTGKTTAVVSGTSVMTDVVPHFRDVSIDAAGCVSLGDVYCGTAETCTSGANLKYWCRSGVCWRVYDGVTPPDGTGPFDTAEECAAACVDAWYCTEDFECVLVAAGDDPPAGASGPHATEGDCAAACEAVGTGCCEGVGVPETLFISLSGGNGSVTMTYAAGFWTGSKALAGCTVSFRISEAGGCAGIEYSRDGSTWVAASCLNGESGCTVTCDPFSVSGTYTFSSAALGGACSFGVITGTLAA
jgi:hypothetical protein